MGGGEALSEQGSGLSGYIGPYWSEAGFVLVISSGIPVAMGPSEIPSLALRLLFIELLVGSGV